MHKIFAYLRLALVTFLGAVTLTGLCSSPASAHWADLAVADVMVRETQVEITLTIPTQLIADADADQDGWISPSEFTANQEQLVNVFHEAIQLTNEQAPAMNFSLKPLAIKPSTTNTNTPAHSSFLLTYDWAQPVKAFTIQYTLFARQSVNTQCLVTVTQGSKVRNFVLTPTKTKIALSEPTPWITSWINFLNLGVKHIFTGYDHILFLLALLLPGGRLRDLLKIVTAFTLAHSLTLTLAALDIITLPSQLVESLIALSIVYVAIENLWHQPIHHRWVITFGFGLVHGLGFANILREFTTAQNNLLIPLASFNLGVELGQVVIVLIAFWGLQVAQKYSWSLLVRQGVSIGMILIGLLWFAERTTSYLSLREFFLIA